MTERSDSQALPPVLQRIASTFRWTGWILFIAQLVLAIISIVILLTASVSRGAAAEPNSQGTGFGIFFAIAGLVALGISIYWGWRYIGLAKKLQSTNPSVRPRKADTLKLLNIGLIVSLVGMFLTILGAEAIVGSILARSFSQPTGLTVYDASRFVRPLDLLIVQANTNAIFAHFVGISANLWLLNRINRT